MRSFLDATSCEQSAKSPIYVCDTKSEGINFEPVKAKVLSIPIQQILLVLPGSVERGPV